MAGIGTIIGAAAQRYGVDPNALSVIAQLESGGDPNAKNPNSSAGGLFQFIDSTAQQYGLTNKFDAAQSADAGARLARDNSRKLASVMGRKPTTGELYLAHQQGAGGASALLRNPNARAVDIVGADAVRLNGGNDNMTAQQFANLWINKAERLAGGDVSLSGGDDFVQGGTGDDTPQETAEDRIHRFYREGLLNDENRAKYEARFGVPEQEAEPQQAAPEPLPPSILDAYNAGTLNRANTVKVADYLAAQEPIGPPVAPADAETTASFGDDLLRQLGLTGRAVAEGGAGLLGVVSDPIASLLNLALDDESQIPALSSSVSSLLTDAGIPNPETVTERIVQEASKALVGGGGTVGLARGAGTALAGATSKGVAGVLAQAPSAQIAGAATSGGAGQAAAEAGAGPVGQIAASLAGGIAGAGGATVAGTRIAPKSASAGQAIQGAERAGITPLTSDVLPPKTFAAKWLQRTGEMIPVAGTGPVRATQQKTRIAAIRNLLRDFGADDAAGASDDVMADLLKTRGAERAKYRTMKLEVFANVVDAGEVPVTQTLKALDDQIAELTSLNSAEISPVIARLKDWRVSVQNQDIDNVEILRAQMGESFKSLNAGDVRSIGEKALSKIYPAIRQDIGDFIKANGDRRDYTRWRVANKRLSASVGDLRVRALKSAMDRGDMTPEAINSLLFSQKPSDAKALFRSLSPDGRANARAAVLDRALRKSTVGDDISPAKFVSELTRLSAPVGVLFRGKDIAQVRGLVRAINLTRRAGDAAVSTPTGLQAVPAVGAAVLTDLLGGFGAGLAGAASIGGASRLYESKPIRDGLIALARVKVGSPEEAAILKRVIAAAQQFKPSEEE